MATLSPCPRCGTESPDPNSRASCRRCHVARFAVWAAGGLGLLCVAGVAFAVAVGGWSPTRLWTNTVCTCPEKPDADTAPCAPSGRTTNRLPLPPHVPSAGAARIEPRSPSQRLKPEAAEATRAPTTVVPLGGGRLLHPGAPGLLLRPGAPEIL